MLQTDQYEAALQLLASTESKNYEFEKAYSLYRQNKESEVDALLSELKEETGEEDSQYRGVLHLEAQLVRSRLYRLPRGSYLLCDTKLELSTRPLSDCA